MTSRFLQLVRPFMSITPEVRKPEREIRFNEKLVWTVVALVVYFVLSATPVFTAYVPRSTDDPFQWLRTIMASSKGTLAELGIGPIVTAGLIMQILVGSKIIKVDMSDPEERALYTGAQKVLAVGMTIFQAAAYVIGGAYNTSTVNIPVQAPEVGLLIIAQLVVAGVAIILLDEMVQKGWGFGSGISLFIAGGVASTIFWNCFSFDTFAGGVYRGGIMAFVQRTMVGLGSNDPLLGLRETFLRLDNPRNSLFAVFATVLVFLVVIYFESMRIELPVTYRKYKGFRSKYPIKLLYVSNIPVILVSAVFADIYFVAQMLWGAWGNADSNSIFALVVNLLGRFESNRAVSGLVFFLTPPQGLLGVDGVIAVTTAGILEPTWVGHLVRAFVYAGLLIVLCIVFSMMWLETAGMGARDVSKQLISAGMQIPGWRASEKVVERRLAMYIPAAAFVGGLFVGLLAAGADFLGALGSGTGILLAVSIMRQYFDILAKEKVADMHPRIRQFLGM